MKKTSILTSAALAAVLTAGSQAYASVPVTPTSWSTGNVSVGNQYVDDEIYSWNISFSSLLTGYTGANLTSGTLDVQIANDFPGDLPVYARIFSALPLGGTSGNLNNGNSDNLVSIGNDYPSANPGWVDFTITKAELNTLEADYKATPTGSIEFSVEVDCELEQYNLTVNAPDGGSTMFLLGGVLTTFGLIKRKLA
jgi:hypothetical protein